MSESEDGGGPGGDVIDVMLALMPLCLLVCVTVKKHNPWPTTVSLPCAAIGLLLIRLMYFASDPVLVTGSVVAGLHEALTPLSIMAGAMLLFETMEATLCLPYMMRECKALTDGHPVAEVSYMLAFGTLVEGASGFGTPVALGAPMLVRLGHEPQAAVVLLLLLNTLATVWGAVGTPLGFGLSGVRVGDVQVDGADSAQALDALLVDVSSKAGVALAVVAFLLVPRMYTLLVPKAMVRANIGFVYLSLAGTVGPILGLAQVNYEFPSLVGGLVGCVWTAALISYRVAMCPVNRTDMQAALGRHPYDLGVNLSERSLAAESSRRQEKYQRNSSSVSDLTGPAPVSARSLLNSCQVGLERLDEDSAGPTELQEDSERGESSYRVNTVDRVPGEEEHDDDALRHFGHEPASAQHDELEDLLGPRKSFKEGYLQELLLRTFPIWGVVLLLILTRVDPIGIKDYLTRREPYFSIHFGTYGTFRLSASLVFQLRDIFSYPGLNWKYELLYVPFLIPFVVVSLAAMLLFRNNLTHSPKEICLTVLRRLKNPSIALMGALVLVQLMINTGITAPAYILGTVLADWFREGFIIICPLLGSLGSFFSGSTTVSNLTFGSIQQVAAEAIGTSTAAMLALQSVGASAGNGICLNNVIAACAVTGLTDVGEGQILKKTFIYVLLETTLATVVMVVLYFRFGA